MPEPCALGERARLCCDPLLVLESGLQVACQAFARGRAHAGSALKRGVGSGCPRGKRLPQSQQMAFGVPHDFHEHPALAPTLAPKATHRFFEGAQEHLARALQDPHGGWTRERLRDVMDYLEDFFWALESVVASGTRWLPCSAGNVSIRT